MATNNRTLTRIYDLRVLGGDKVNSALKSINQALEENARLKALASKNSVTAEELAEIEKYKTRIKELTAEELKLKAAQKEATNEKRALAIATTEAANAAKKEKDALVAVQGSYAETKKLMAELRPLIQNANKDSQILFQGEKLDFSQAIEEYKRLSTAEQNFRRQFTKDNLLVGEYSSGILKAFKDNGLDEVVKGQIQRQKQELKSLDQSFAELKKQLTSIAAAGKGGFDAIEKEMIENRNQANELRASIAGIEKQMAKMGGIGGRLTSSLNKGFADAKRSLGSLVAGYLSLQAIIGSVTRVYNDTIALDSLQAAMKEVSGSQYELAKNNEFLEITTQRLGAEYISTANAFKNFYAASTLAGIGADETRTIFESAVSAASNLKLSQENTNGVLLAFSQIASKGKVQAEELRGQIGERIPGAFSIAAKAIGVTQGELNKMLENGEVVSNTFLPKFAAELRKTFGGNSDKEIKGLQASVNRLKNEFTSMIEGALPQLTVFFNVIIGFASFLIGSLPIIIGLVSLWAAGWLLMNKQLIITRTLVPILTALFGSKVKAIQALTVATNFWAAAKAKVISLLKNPVFRSIGLVIGGLTLAFTSFASSLKATNQQLDVTVRKKNLMREASQEANKELSSTIEKEKQWIKIATDVNVEIEVREKALEKLKEMMGSYGEALTLENLTTKEGIKLLKEYNEEIYNNALARASASIQQREQAKLDKLVQYQFDIQKAKASGTEISTAMFDEEFMSKYYQQQGRGASSVGKWIADKVGIDFTYSGKDLDAFAKLASAEIANQQLEVQAAIANNLKNEVKNTPKTQTTINVFEAFARFVREGGKEEDIQKIKDEIDLQKKGLNMLSKEYKGLVALEKQIEEFLNPKEKKERKKSEETATDRLKDQYEQEKKLLETQFSDKAITEQAYNESLIKLATDYREKKLVAIKAANKKEKEQQVSFNAELAKDQADANKKLFDIQTQNLEENYNTGKRIYERELNIIDEDPKLSNTKKLKAREELNLKLLILQTRFNSEMESLEIKFNQRSVKGEEERANAIVQILKNLKKLRLDQFNAIIADLEKAADQALALKNIEFNELDKKILDQKNKSINNKEADLEKSNIARRISLKSIELDYANRQLEAAKKQYEQNKITAEQYQRYYDAAINAQIELNNAIEDGKTRITSFQQLLQRGITKLFNLGEGSDIQKLLGETIAQSFDMATEAMNNFFDLKAERIQQERDLAYELIDLEKEQQLSRAQSQDERDSLERQAAAKKREADRKAFEENKKMQIAQAKINLAMQLSNLAVVAFAPNPLNIATLGIAGAIMYATQAALAVANYAMNVSKINSAQAFATGGRVKPKPLGNGKISATPNIPNQPNGDNIFATVRTGEVILNEEQQRKLGGARTFAQIGVPGFAMGGPVGMYKWALPSPVPGSFLKAPSDLSFLKASQAGSTGDIQSLILEQQKSIAFNAMAIKDVLKQTNERIDKIKVEVVSQEVSEKEKEIKAAEAIGRLR
ncbi:MAG: tape measure protein [Ferruginibacter sp.]|nr:tape measure protein [Ferruginibacter sp.]